MPALRRTLLVGATATLASCTAAISMGSGATHDSALAEIRTTLDHGARAWNAGDLDDFLSDYLADSSTTFVTPRGVLHGIPAIRGVYAARFAPGGKRDSLHFESLEVDLLAPGVANAIAFYVLQRKDSVTAKGPTSLLMRRVNGKWKIVHDHSS